MHLLSVYFAFSHSHLSIYIIGSAHFTLFVTLLSPQLILWLFRLSFIFSIYKENLCLEFPVIQLVVFLSVLNDDLFFADCHDLFYWVFPVVENVL